MTTEQEHGGERLAAVSNAVVQILSECYGRGPTKAKTYTFDNYCAVVMHDIFTTVERTLIQRGREELVRATRLAFQDALGERFIAAVEDNLGVKVRSYHSQVIIEPATGIEFFILED
jgi:uncharacterized protein YbcI